MGGRFATYFLCSALASMASIPVAWAAPLDHLAVAIDGQGNYSIGAPGSATPVLVSGIATKIDGRWLHSASYPRHTVVRSLVEGFLGHAVQWQVDFSGLPGQPELIYRLRAYDSEPFADVQVTVRNNTANSFDVESIRAVEAAGNSAVALDGPSLADRVLSDSFSEDRPTMRIHDLSDADHGMHRAVGSQLIYNRDSHESLFVGALTSERFLTVARLFVNGSSDARITRYEVDSTGTTEIAIGNSLKDSSTADRIELRLPVPPEREISSEVLALSIGSNYYHQLETYGSLIRRIHHARVSAPPLMGWWSWTANYFGLNQATALTNAEWEAEHLKPFGYEVFHIDEGYQYARGEYATPDAALFPKGLAPLEYAVRGLGLTPGIWTAPFEVSERSSVYQQHRDWLVKNAQGRPIPIGAVTDGKDRLYVLDTTNPRAQRYLCATYTKFVREWNLRYIKLDFMEDTAIEGYYYKPHTTALEAQRTGLEIIRKAVGDDVYLDKDGSPMLNPVGYVDYGRISQDTGHTFGATRDEATGIAARYYMDRNFFVSDPDTFIVYTHRTADQSRHDGNAAPSLAEARVSIALAAVSGGMFEIGDNLPALENAPDGLVLVENRDLIDMVRLGKASLPVDLMDYADSDRQPSIFYLKESDRQSMLTVFNWTDAPRTKSIPLSNLGLNAERYMITDVFGGTGVVPASGAISLQQPPHSVRMLKIVDARIPTDAPEIDLDCHANGITGENAVFSAGDEAAGRPALSFRWDFGDGVQVDGQHVSHAWTAPGDYVVRVMAQGLDGTQSKRTCSVHVSGTLSTEFLPSQKKRYDPR